VTRALAEPKPKVKIQKQAVPVPKQKPEVRSHNFSEVTLGYTEEQALAEADRNRDSSFHQAAQRKEV
jgi:hypothetical protein